MTLAPADILLAPGLPGAALCLEPDGREVAWHGADGVQSASLEAFLAGRTPEVLRLPDPLRRKAEPAFPPSIDPRHVTVREREFAAFLNAGQPVAREEAMAFIQEAARAQVGRNFLEPGATATEQETAAVVFILNSLRSVECCHGVIARQGIGFADLRRGNFQLLK